MAWNGKVPFNISTGDLLDYYTGLGYPDDTNVMFEDNYKFYGKLIIVDCIKGRSAIHIILIDPHTGCKYNMFLSDLMNIIKKSVIKNGEVEGEWTFHKRGSNYGIYLIKGPELESNV